ncbi:hypothetical protein [Bifidobacterium sp. SO1]|uniref:hypothetical protein n=1 Tax=Bifidobacterium sp. SO1 TaxID=2809029 RepID=UPI001BDD2577|nr:hypothetical protein [Bifidobacterium sp. SO1]MBT1162951.1 hypothetical protein [Bifidobacterium sp. SO1]
MPDSDEQYTRLAEYDTDVPLSDMQEDLDRQLRRAKVKEARNALRYRSVFLWWGILATSFCIIASTVTVWALFRYGGYREMAAVLIAYISGMTVEVIGIAVVIAKYLFPSTGANNDGKADDNS